MSVYLCIYYSRDVIRLNLLHTNYSVLFKLRDKMFVWLYLNCRIISINFLYSKEMMKLELNNDCMCNAAQWLIYAIFYYFFLVHYYTLVSKFCLRI